MASNHSRRRHGYTRVGGLGSGMITLLFSVVVFMTVIVVTVVLNLVAVLVAVFVIVL